MQPTLITALLAACAAALRAPLRFPRAPKVFAAGATTDSKVTNEDVIVVGAAEAAEPAVIGAAAAEDAVARAADALDLSMEDIDELSAAMEPVNCARGVCVVDSTEEAEAPAPLWPKALLLGSSVLYGTNFALGRIMNEALPASASTSARFVLAAAALSPWLFRLAPSLRGQALICGCFTALGYVSQSIALVDTPAATVAFLGALTVVVCPACAFLVEKRDDLGPRDSPQVWLAAALSLAGVACLELPGLSEGVGLGGGDVWSILQAVGFGTSFYLTERMMAREPTQALPITACQVAVVALVAAVWAFADGASGGWLLDSAAPGRTLPGLFLDEGLRPVALAAAWTGFVTTAANRVAETTALGQVSSSEAAVLLATEPLWAAAFGALLVGEALSPADAVGGLLIVAACATAASDRDEVRRVLGLEGS